MEIQMAPGSILMTHAPSRRIRAVQAPMIPVVGGMIRRHPGTISLGQGVVHYGPPAAVAEVVARAVREDSRVHRYGLAFGIDELLDAIRAKLAAENGLTVGPDRRLAVTAGGNMGFLNAVLAVADVGDEIILPGPYYFNHEMAVAIAGCRAVVVPTDADYQPDLAAIEVAMTSRTRAVVTVSPNNPTGAVYHESALRAINELCRRHGRAFHIADEAYEYFTYGGARHFSPASLPGSEGHTIGLYSLSKSYGMAGWRMGYMVMPASLDEPVKKIQDTNLICPPVLNQIAALAALGAGRAWCDVQTRDFARVRDLVLGELRRLGDRVHVPEPGGAFYALARVNTTKTDMELVEALIRDFGVAVMPGSTFGTPADTCYLRVAYGALDERTVAEGMGRLVRGLQALV
jgi:aspartate/methionine/tyrosine aminotransferase